MKAALLAAALAAALAAQVAGAAAPSISLRISFWPNEAEPAVKSTWTLRCFPAQGTLPRAATACRRLARLGPVVFEPIPPDSVCTQIYGGPQLAVVRGLFGTHRLRATFRRRNGCEILRWNRVSFLFPHG